LETIWTLVFWIGGSYLLAGSVIAFTQLCVDGESDRPRFFYANESRAQQIGFFFWIVFLWWKFIYRLVKTELEIEQRRGRQD
jgi:hypothetical protein